MPSKKIILGSDHAGFKLKESVKKFLTESGYDVDDAGADSYNQEDDYPGIILSAAKKVAESNGRGIVFGGSGQGEAIVANKVRGIRAALYHGGDMDIVRLSRTHNNSNILSLGARFVGEEEALEAVKTWLETDFTNEERHKRRVKQISQIEEKTCK